MPKLIFIFPVVIMCVMPWVMNMEIKNIVVDVVDNDRSTVSQQLVHSIEASKYFIFNGQKTSYNDALDDVEKCKADVIVEIPYNYSRDLLASSLQGRTGGEAPLVLIAANAVNGTKGSMGTAYLSNIVTMNTANNTKLAVQHATVSNLSQLMAAMTKILSTLYI